MSIASKILLEPIFIREHYLRFRLTREMIVLFFLALLTLMSGVMLVYIKDWQRRLTYQLETVQQMADRQQVEWRQLLLEQSTYATHQRISQSAQQQLQMVEPAKIYVVRVIKNDAEELL